MLFIINSIIYAYKGKTCFDFLCYRRLSGNNPPCIIVDNYEVYDINNNVVTPRLRHIIISVKIVTRYAVPILYYVIIQLMEICND